MPDSSPAPQQKPPLLTREVLVAITAAVAFGVGFWILLDWGPIPAVIGGASIGVIWWSVDRAFKR